MIYIMRDWVGKTAPVARAARDGLEGCSDVAHSFHEKNKV